MSQDCTDESVPFRLEEITLCIFLIIEVFCHTQLFLIIRAMLKSRTKTLVVLINRTRRGKVIRRYFYCDYSCLLFFFF